MKNPYIRVFVLNLIHIGILYLLFASGIQKYLQSSNIYIFASASIIGSIIAIAVTWMFFSVVDRQPLRLMKFHLHGKQLQFVLLSTLIMLGLYMVATFVMGKFGLVSVKFNHEYFSNPQIIPMFLISAVSWFLVGVNEEILFRGYSVANLKHLSVTKLFVISSVFFMFSHIFKGVLNPIMLLVTLISAITLMYVYVKTGSIMAVIIPHFVYDFSTNQLFSSSKIGVFHYREVPGDLYSAVLFFLFIPIQIILVKILFKRKTQECIKKFKQPASPHSKHEESQIITPH